MLADHLTQLLKFFQLCLQLEPGIFLRLQLLLKVRDVSLLSCGLGHLGGSVGTLGYWFEFRSLIQINFDVCIHQSILQLGSLFNRLWESFFFLHFDFNVVESLGWDSGLAWLLWNDVSQRFAASDFFVDVLAKVWDDWAWAFAFADALSFDALVEPLFYLHLVMFQLDFFLRGFLSFYLFFLGLLLMAPAYIILRVPLICSTCRLGTFPLRIHGHSALRSLLLSCMNLSPVPILPAHRHLPEEVLLITISYSSKYNLHIEVIATSIAHHWVGFNKPSLWETMTYLWLALTSCMTLCCHARWSAQ